MPGFRSVALAFVAWSALACGPRFELPPGAQVTCTSAGECPPESECRPAISRCVPRSNSDRTPPALVGIPQIRPEVAKAGDDLTVSFSVTEPLFFAPVVRVGDQGLAQTQASADGMQLTYSWKVAPTVPEGVPVAVTVELVDQAGNAAAGLAAGSARFDFTAPRLIPIGAVTPLRVARGGVVTVSLAASEALRAAPTVEMAPADGAGAGGAAKAWTMTHEDLATHGYTFSYTVGEDEAEGSWSVRASALDSAGNPSAVLELGQVGIDRSEPSVYAADVMPQVAGAGRAVAVQIQLLERVKDGATLEAVSQDRRISFAPGEQQPQVLTFLHTVAEDEDGQYELELGGLVDLAGNPADPIRLPGASLILDTKAPVPTVSVTTPKRSDKAGHRLAAIHFTSQGEFVRQVLQLDGFEVTLCSSATDGGYDCTYEVSGAEHEGTVPVYLELVDAAGNAGHASTSLTLDFTGPKVVDASVDLAYVVKSFGGGATQCPLWSVDALSDSSRARLYFSVDEPVSPAGQPAVSAAGLAFSRDPSTSSHTSFVYTLDLSDPPLASGTYDVSIALEDEVGNPGHAALQGRLKVDTEPPEAPAVSSPGQVLYERFPWGDESGAVAFRVSGKPDPLIPTGTKVRVLDDFDEGRALELARGAYGAQGFALGYSGSDHAAVYVQTLDGACNRSPPLAVREVSWTATLNHKLGGSSFENPHDFEERRFFEPASAQPDALAVSSKAAVQVATRDAVALTTSGAGDWSPRGGLGLSPSPRAELGMAYDAGHGLTIVFGSADRDGVTWGFDGASWGVLAEADPTGLVRPSPRTAPSMAYDEARGRVVLFGGDLPFQKLGDTWEWDGKSWALRVPEDPTGQRAPLPRAGAAMAYDAQRGRTVLVGGDTQGGPVDDTWEWDGVEWKQRTVDDPEKDGDPGARSYASAAWDRVRKVVVLFGGYEVGLGINGQTWEYDGLSWALRTPTDPELDGNPAPAQQAALAYDAARGRSVLFGGTAGVAVAGDTWEWDGTSWAKAHPAVAPAARKTFGLAFAGAGGETVLFGGATSGGASVLGDVWTWDGAEWTQCTPQPATSGSPEVLSGACMAYDPGRERLVIFGGLTPSVSGSRSRSDTWEWDGATWRRFPRTSGPTGREYCAMAYDPERETVVMFGGIDDDDLGTTISFGDCWEWDGATWTPVSSTLAPTARWGHSLTAVPNLGLVLFGGESLNGPSAETWVLEPTGWRSDKGATPPPGRYLHAAAYDPARGVVIVAGRDDSQTLQDVWFYDGSAWTAGPSGPGPRAGAAAAYDAARGRLMVIGGDGAPPGGASFLLDDVLELDGQGWVNRGQANPMGDGSPGPTARQPAAWIESRRQVALFGADSRLWLWNGGADARPAQVARVRFAASGAENAQFLDLQKVQLRWAANARCAGAAVSPAFWVWDSNAFVPLAMVPDAAGPGRFEWSASDLGAARRLFLGPGEELAAAVGPAAPNGGSVCEVSTDYVELTVGYRL
ncbi:MAG: kelch repeat-containing protein [Myxococcales bacterium]